VNFSGFILELRDMQPGVPAKTRPWLDLGSQGSLATYNDKGLALLKCPKMQSREGR
jgi:hypothetical protein